MFSKLHGEVVTLDFFRLKLQLCRFSTTSDQTHWPWWSIFPDIEITYIEQTCVPHALLNHLT